MAQQQASEWKQAAIYLTSGQIVAIVSMNYAARQFLIQEEYQDSPYLREPVQLARYPGQNDGLGVSSIITSIPEKPGGIYTFVTADDEEFDATPFEHPHRIIR